ncbi:beta-glucosidase [Frondihabitans sp. PhB188]|uniref:beta-glucosidase family protein n=1 Tax=Frondihabitans sp. PhB188 TaxID=2485200 RepID=UPI000F4812A0|nr:glycoside hydrolase family 3 C-terminal domain-containing protein [Frondihabitans sp. PhB188]ROQ38661.1 beta-glucosidase [Frondihabitans sp. PhB188]
MTDTLATIDARLQPLLDSLTLEEKVQLLTGRDFWTTWPIQKIGLRRLLMSDGPSGVRGEVWDERSPSLNLPSATVVSSSWDTAIAARYGAAAAVEARRKGVDVVLGPTINLHRSPLGGRHFEAFSEDPVLTAELAASYVDGMQENGVAATPKHYVANDSETDRFTVDVNVAERPLRELYLLAFEKAVTESKTWAIMSAYNSINGVTATENELLETPLATEWGFDGAVISDWTAVRSLESAKASQDIVMPGPDGPWGEALVAAVRAGEIAEEAVDRKVLRILRLAQRVGALEGFDPAVAEPALVEDGIAFAREAAAAGSVLLVNRDELPWADAVPASIAVIGHNAEFARSQGGGSATVLPEHVVSPLEGLRSRFGADRITYSVGAVVQEGIAELARETIANPVSGGPGLRAAFLDADDVELFGEDRLATALVWFGGDAPIAESSTLQLSTVYTPTATGTIKLGFAAAGTATIVVDGVEVLHATVVPEGTDLGAAFLSPPTRSVPVAVTEGESIAVTIRVDLTQRDAGALGNAMSFAFGIEPNDDDPEALIAEAAEAAAAAEVAVVVVGTNSRVESEGYDRSNLDLPGRQDDLVRAVVAANPRTVVVVNSGAPVLLPWRDEVAAVVIGYFGGQEIGNALADVLSGDSEPGGRLPTTWPAALADVPVIDVTPEAGALHYDEGIHIGYRAWLRAGTEPAFPFGFGLGYTTFELSNAAATSTAAVGDTVTVTVDVANTGERRGKQVVQVYASKTDSAIERPVRWLVGFAPVVVDAGATETATVEFPVRLLADWQGGWHQEPGEFELHVGASVVDLPLTQTLVISS